MEIIMVIIGILVCIMFSIIILMYIVLAYQLYKVKKKAIFFNDKRFNNNKK